MNDRYHSVSKIGTGLRLKHIVYVKHVKFQGCNIIINASINTKMGPVSDETVGTRLLPLSLSISLSLSLSLTHPLSISPGNVPR